MENKKMKWVATYFSEKQDPNKFIKTYYVPKNVISDLESFIDHNYPDKIDGVKYVAEINSVTCDGFSDDATISIVISCQGNKLFSSIAWVPCIFIELKLNIKQLDDKQFELTWDGNFDEFSMTFVSHRNFIFLN